MFVATRWWCERPIHDGTETLDAVERANQARNIPTANTLSRLIPEGRNVSSINVSDLRELEAELERVRSNQLTDGRSILGEEELKDIRVVTYRSQQLHNAIEAYDENNRRRGDRPSYEEERALLVIAVLGKHIIKTDFRRRRDRRVQLGR